MADDLIPEEIGDSETLLRRIHRHFFDPDSGRISSGAFDGSEMSVNWDKYANAADTAAQDLTGNILAVVSLSAGTCRNLEQEVQHDPTSETAGARANQAHSLVRGKKSRPIKQKLRDASTLVWQAEFGKTIC